jgi:dipeptidyl-peptidase-3
MGNGIHHHYSMDKFIPKFSETFLAEQIKALAPEQIPLQAGQSVEYFIAWISPIIFDPNKDAKKVSLDSSSDVILASANNFYDGVTQQEVEDFYKQMKVE